MSISNPIEERSRFERAVPAIIIAALAVFISYYTGYRSGWAAHQNTTVSERIVMQSKYNRNECYLVEIVDADLKQTPVKCPEDYPAWR